METNKKLSFKEGNTYFFICYSLVCGGKSSFFNIIKEYIKKYDDKYNVNFVSSDEIREKLAKKLNESNKDWSYQKCFDSVGKNTAKEFDKEVQKAIDSKVDDKINLILVDKNYPQGIDKFLKLFCKDKEHQFFIIFTPKITNQINIMIDQSNNKKIYFPFSLDYFIQCYLRLKNRKGHETLNGDDTNSTLVYISFMKLFQDFVFKEKVCTDKAYVENVFIKEIPFTDESKNLSMDNESLEFFKKVIYKIRAFKMDEITKNYKEDIDNYFTCISALYDNKNFFTDTRPDIQKLVEEFFKEGI